VPRWLNQAAHQAIKLAEDGELTKVDAEAALEALSMLGLAPADETEASAEKDSAHPHIQQFMRTA
jgi:hypothetical protein